jgi:hypothetical protein
MSSIREVCADGWRVRLDLAGQVLHVEVPEVARDWDCDEDADRLMPTLPHTDDGHISAATLLLKAKQFDDGLYAAVELAAQHGAGRFPGKAPLLRSLAATLAAGHPNGQATAFVHAACELGGLPVVAAGPIQQAAHVLADDFLDNELASKPLGFYTWNPELSAIFRQDRFLQQPLDPDPADDLARALKQTPGALAAHDACLRLNARLTNPRQKLSIWDAGKRSPFFPPSRSHEVTLFEDLYEDQPIPEGFDLMEELIRRVRSGKVRLMPGEQSGWYDHQVWSLEPLLLPDRRPEAARLALGKRYRKHLEDLFRGALALTRETHAKQAGGGRGGYGGPTQRPLWIHPGLTVEPLPTAYARRAASYRFVRTVLEEEFGAGTLANLHRLRPEGTLAAALAEELAWIEELFAGAAATASMELGMGLPDGGAAAAHCCSEWRTNLRSDADVSRDVRMMVPVFDDVQRKKTKVWAFLGWRTTTVEVEYRVQPIVLTVEPLNKPKQPPGQLPPVLFSGDCYELAVPVLAEVYVERLLDRTEFQRHCDRFRTRKAILANLR